jgi:branched-chain amino acid transport system substrate-binding protein
MFGKSYNWRTLSASPKSGRLAAVAALSLFLAACGGAGGNQQGGDGSAGTIKLGSLHPLSGGLEFEGKEAHQGVLVAVEEVNDAGGIKSMDGAQVEVVSEDTAADPERATGQATRMAQDGVAALLGTMSSGVGLAIQPISERSEVPFMITAAADPELTARGLQYTFRAHPTVEMSVEGAIEALKGLSQSSGKPIKRVAHLRLEISAYEAVSDLLEEKLPEAGMELVDVVSAPLEATDFSTQVTQIKRSKPDVLVMSALLAQSLEIEKTMEAQDFRPPFTVGIAAGFTHPGFVKELPELAENIGDVTYWYDANSEIWDKFSQEYEAKYGSTPTTHAAQGYQAAMVVMDALERAGTAEGPELREALASTSLEEHLLPQEGPIRFGDDGQNPDVQSPMTQLIDGQAQIVFPEKFAETEPVFPDKLATYGVGAQ